MSNFLELLAQHLGLGGLLSFITERFGSFELADHWTQGEFHHDVVLRLSGAPVLGGDILVVATNCNGGVKEILRLEEVPDRWALWHSRCPDNPEFSGTLPPVLESVRTLHWFNPCELLTPEARSELKPACRRRAKGGGWEPL